MRSEEFTALAEKYGDKVVVDVEKSVAHSRPEARLFKANPTMHRWDCALCSMNFVKGSSGNLSRASHARKHIREGTAISVYGGADGIFVAPSAEDVEKEITRRTRHVEVIAPALDELRAKIKPLAARHTELSRARSTIESKLIDTIRKCDPHRGTLINSTVTDAMTEIADTSKLINEVAAQMDAMIAEYPEDVGGKLTMGDLS